MDEVESDGFVEPLVNSREHGTGIALKVRRIQGDDCVVRHPGTVLRKTKMDLSFPIACLIQIFPYPKN